MEIIHVACTIVVGIAGIVALAFGCFGAYIDWYSSKQKTCSRCKQDKPLTHRVCKECYERFKKRIGETW